MAAFEFVGNKFEGRPKETPVALRMRREILRKGIWSKDLEMSIPGPGLILQLHDRVPTRGLSPSRPGSLAARTPLLKSCDRGNAEFYDTSLRKHSLFTRHDRKFT